jgi:predicted O-methyltransferase YrrM
MNFIDPLAEQYADKYSDKLDVLLKEIEDFTVATHPKSHMLSGAVQGKFLEMISTMIKPLRVLEIGTLTGFSALCLAKGLAHDGILHTIETREEDAQTAKRFFDKSEMKEKIQLHIGNAHEIIPSLNESWDLVFIDADKVSYIDYYELTLPQVKSGGWILADNVLFHGQVLNDEMTGKNPKAIHAFNEHVSKDERTEKVMLTIRDGLTLIRKK